jgi:hypothetical protein
LIPDVSFQFETGVKQFSTTKELRLYLKKLLDSYEKTRDMVEFIAADMLRDRKTTEEAQSKGWFKVNELFVNKSDQTRASMDILFQILRESKPKIRSVEESLRAFERFESMAIPDDAGVLLYLRDGVPDRIVVGEGAESPQKHGKKAA